MDEYSPGMHCESCGAEIDPEDESQFDEASGWYTCPQCGHSNSDE